MTRRTITALAAAAALVLLPALAAPQAQAISFVDKQVQAGGLLIQNYINKYGAAHEFVFPPKTMVKKGGGLPDSTLMWPANPWTGRTMASGTSRGAYTYTLGAGGMSYKLTMHFSKGSYVFRGSMPAWLKDERNTAAKQNLLLLQRYLADYHLAHSDYPAALDATTFPPGEGYVWPLDPWSGAAMAAGDGLGQFSYARGGASSYTLKVKLTGGWSPTLGPIL
jgi:type II secretory pathway pseudopilin PulG